MIDGVKITTLKRIPDERGMIMHIMKNSDDSFEKFGEVYCSTIYPGVVKGWHYHKKMTLNYVVIKGNIKFVLYDNRDDSPTKGKLVEIIIGERNYVRVTVPPKVWNGFKCIGLEEAFVINFTDIPHAPDEIVRMEPHNNQIIDYNWKRRDR